MNVARERLDQVLVRRGIVSTRSQAESYIKLGQVTVDGRVVQKPGMLVGVADEILLHTTDRYVSRAALKLASIAETFALDFSNKVVLDVGSSTGGFTDYALQHGAKKVIAVELGKEQLHPSLRGNVAIELHEQTDIRNLGEASERVDVVVADVSFVSLRDILPSVIKIAPQAQFVIMVKPQFEAQHNDLKHKGVIKNERVRRDILSAFETWAKQHFIILNKADSAVAGARGNKERFYLFRAPVGR
jgi:23S rRNA (cytidine1920-2'-O)/16S rRNA (cytidine1409-2'-O)-methyltransferase